MMKDTLTQDHAMTVATDKYSQHLSAVCVGSPACSFSLSDSHTNKSILDSRLCCSARGSATTAGRFCTPPGFKAYKERIIAQVQLDCALMLDPHLACQTVAYLSPRSTALSSALCRRFMPDRSPFLHGPARPGCNSRCKNAGVKVTVLAHSGQED